MFWTDVVGTNEMQIPYLLKIHYTSVILQCLRPKSRFPFKFAVNITSITPWNTTTIARQSIKFTYY
jgi:hypothetical protein